MMKALLVTFAARLPGATSIRSFVSADLRDALRSLAATPLVTAVTVVSLALGTGANTTLFSILNSLVMRPLPVREPQRLAMVGRTSWTNPIWEQIRDRQADLFERTCAWSVERFNLAGSGRIDPVEGAYVSGGLFRTLGRRPGSSHARRRCGRSDRRRSPRRMAAGTNRLANGSSNPAERVAGSHSADGFNTVVFTIVTSPPGAEVR